MLNQRLARQFNETLVCAHAARRATRQHGNGDLAVVSIRHTAFLGDTRLWRMICSPPLDSNNKLRMLL
jgi:hypothetical protein